MTRVRNSYGLLATLIACRSDGHGESSSETTSSAESTESTATTMSATAEASAADSSAGSTGPTAVCGNGLVETGVQCDGADVAGHACPDMCRFPEKMELWSVLVDVHGLDDAPHDVVVDADGAVYVAGETTTGKDGGDPLVVRISDDGVVDWMVAEPLEAGATEGWYGIAITDDALYVTGVMRHDTSPMITRRLDLDGATTWTVEYVGPVEEAEYRGEAVALRPDGDLIVAGLQVLDLDVPVVLLQYDTDGMLVDDARVDGPIYDKRQQLSDVGVLDMAVDPSAGTRVLAGEAFTGAATRFDGWILVTSGEQATLWEGVVPGPSGGVDGYFAVALDPTGWVAAGIFEPEPGVPPDIWVHKYDAAGTRLWEATYDGGIVDEDRAHGVAIDTEGNIFVHGNTAVTPLGEGHDIDLWLRKYDPDGNEIWTDTWSGEGIAPGVESWDYASEIAIDPHGFVVVTAKTRTAERYNDVLVRKIAP